MLLATIDLGDPGFPTSSCGELLLPLFSYINYEGLLEEQEYRLDATNSIATFTLVKGNAAPMDAEDAIRVPLPERVLNIREMVPGELPLDESTYWTSVDTFLGGESFLRFGGPPIFGDEFVSDPPGFSYLASIGYEPYNSPGGYLPHDEPFFLGEVALYFFVSTDWTRVKVITQAC